MNFEYIKILSREYEKKNHSNLQYSLRAFARDLGINPGSLSGILNGDRKFPLTKVEDVSTFLNLPADEAKLFKKSVEMAHFDLAKLAARYGKKTSRKKQEVLTSFGGVMLQNILTSWEACALLSLLEIERYSIYQVDAIASRLEAKVDRIQEVVDIFISEGWLTLTEQNYLKRSAPFISSINNMSQDKSNDACENILKLLGERLKYNSSTIEFQSLTVATTPERIKSAKLLIQEFYSALVNYLSLPDSTKGEEVCQLSMQLLPLTVSEKKEEAIKK